MGRRIGLAGLAAGLVLAGCETVPYAQRLATYEAGLNAFVGRSVDEVVIAHGVPDSTFTLTDGRQVLQYTSQRTVTSGGDSWTSWDTVRRTRSFREPDGTVRQVVDEEQVPVQRTNPIVTRDLRCTLRFVIKPDKTVESARWEGNSCVP
jgi:hypothetical protein